MDEADLESRLDQIEAVMGAEMAQPFRLLLHWYARLLGLLREKKLSIGRLQRMLFGASTERTSSVLSSAAESSGQVEDTSVGNSADHPARHQGGPRRRRPNHGRIPASDYTGCAKVAVTHASLRPGDACPHCTNGTVYRQSRWSPVVRLKGQPPVTGQVYQLERLRCGECGDIFTAELPEEAGPDKYDPTVAAVIATLRYGEGMPWNRLQRLQELAGVPLPASDQWEQVRNAAERGPREAFRHLVGLAAQGDLMHNDDTTMRVLELMETRPAMTRCLARVLRTANSGQPGPRARSCFFVTGGRHGEGLAGARALSPRPVASGARGEDKPGPMLSASAGGPVTRHYGRDASQWFRNSLSSRS